jgi:hypothetical protein
MGERRIFERFRDPHEGERHEYDPAYKGEESTMHLNDLQEESSACYGAYRLDAAVTTSNVASFIAA